MRDIQTVSGDLKLTQIEARKLQKELESTPLWKSYQAARRKEVELERQLEFLKSEAARIELEEHFECVTGHEYEHYSQEFLIVHKDCPHIVSIAGADGLWEIGVKGKTVLPREADALILSSDDSKEGAWKRAVEAWSSMGEWERDLLLGKS